MSVLIFFQVIMKKLFKNKETISPPSSSPRSMNIPLSIHISNFVFSILDYRCLSGHCFFGIFFLLIKHDLPIFLQLWFSSFPSPFPSPSPPIPRSSPFFFWSCSIWDISSLIRDLTHAPCMGSLES